MADQKQIRRHPASVLRVSFEHPSTGERAEVAAWDASLGGMFLETTSPLDEGALLALEITTASAKVSADARVLWRRAASEGPNQPAGMAVRFIDLPDDVSVALNRALQGGMAEKTILGIGGATQEPTTPGLMPGVVTAERVPRETQIGVAPPANTPAKPRLEISDTSLPETPAAPAAAAPKPEPEPAKPEVEVERPKERAPARGAASSAPPPPPGTGGVFGRVLLLLVLGGAAGAVYVYRDAIAEMLAGSPAPSATAPSATAPVESATPEAEPVDAAPGASEDASADVEAAAIAAGGAEDAATANDAGHADAGRSSDAGARDAGARDAGRDSGAHGGVRHDAGRAPKHP